MLFFGGVVEVDFVVFFIMAIRKIL